jgi:hypothetical protein
LSSSGICREQAAATAKRERQPSVWDDIEGEKADIVKG